MKVKSCKESVSQEYKWCQSIGFPLKKCRQPVTKSFFAALFQAVEDDWATLCTKKPALFSKIDLFIVDVVNSWFMHAHIRNAHAVHAHAMHAHATRPQIVHTHAAHVYTVHTPSLGLSVTWRFLRFYLLSIPISWDTFVFEYRLICFLVKPIASSWPVRTFLNI